MKRHLPHNIWVTVERRNLAINQESGKVGDRNVRRGRSEKLNLPERDSKGEEVRGQKLGKK